MSQSGPPYAPTTASAGGVPNTSVDVPVTAVFLFLYICFAATNMTILQLNLRKGHKFIISGALFGFCMARISTTTLRLAWATHQTNVRLSIAANIFVSAGILIVYVVNLIFAQRILRAKQPHVGWNKALRGFFKGTYVVIGLALVAVIISSVLSLYTLDPYTRQVCRDIQLTASTYLFVFTTQPLFVLGLAYVLPKHPESEHFGQGHMNKKAAVNLASTLICVLISGFKCGTAWMAPRPINNPAWYQSKAAFYVFNFTLEICILILFVSLRIDKLFHVPNGSKGPGDYSNKNVKSSQSSDHGDVEVEKA